MPSVPVTELREHLLSGGVVSAGNAPMVKHHLDIRFDSLNVMRRFATIREMKGV